MEIGFRILMFILGACIGSFLCCQVRRLHARTTAKGKSKKPLGTRSICLNCHKRLKWYDNIPLASWLILRGKCRHCHKKIGIAEFFSELGTALALLLISNTINITAATPFDWAIFLTVLLLTFTLIFLAIYDGAYGELPSPCLTFSIICAIIIVVLRSWASLSVSPFTPSLITDPLLAVLILGGLYLALYLISKGKWVGDGDWILCTAIALALGSPWLALIVLFLSNAAACIAMYPLIKGKKHHKVHFGPFLVIAFVIAYSFSDFFLSFVL